MTDSPVARLDDLGGATICTNIITRTSHSEAIIVRGTGYDVDR